MGYDMFEMVESGDLKNYDLFVCGICLEILKDPVMIKECEHVYCRDCIDDSIEKKTYCPEDKTSITKDDLIPPNRLFCDLYGKIKIRCRHFKTGCQEVLFLKNYEEHVINCEFIHYECSECGFESNKVEMANHYCNDYLMNKIESLTKTLSDTKRELSKAKIALFSRMNPQFKVEQELKGTNSISTLDTKRFDLNAVRQAILPKPGTEENEDVTSGDTQENGGFIKFKSPIEAETVYQTILATISSRIQSITAMDEYEDSSFEELRWDDYQTGFYNSTSETEVKTEV